MLYNTIKITEVMEIYSELLAALDRILLSLPYISLIPGGLQKYRNGHNWILQIYCLYTL